MPWVGGNLSEGKSKEKIPQGTDFTVTVSELKYTIFLTNVEYNNSMPFITDPILQ